MPPRANRLTIDAAGRVTLPRSLRRRLRLEPGDTLHLDAQDDRITLSPVRPPAPLRQEDGIWVYGSGQPVTVPLRDLIEETRGERDASLLGGAR